MSVVSSPVGRSLRVGNWLRHSRHTIRDEEVRHFCRDMYGNPFSQKKRVLVVMVEGYICFVCPEDPRIASLEDVSMPSRRDIRKYFKANFPGIRFARTRRRDKTAQAKPNQDGLRIKAYARDDRKEAVRSVRSHRVKVKQRKRLAPCRRGLPFHHRGR